VVYFDFYCLFGAAAFGSGGPGGESLAKVVLASTVSGREQVRRASVLASDEAVVIVDRFAEVLRTCVDWWRRSGPVWIAGGFIGRRRGLRHGSCAM
jgi:hypothetical protein